MNSPESKPQGSESHRNWPEDFGSENGNYMNACWDCGQHFLGHKRRFTCKLCALAKSNPDNYETPPLPNPSSDEEVERIADRLFSMFCGSRDPLTIGSIGGVLKEFSATLSQQHNAELSASCDAARNKLAEAQSEIDQLRASLAEKESELATAQRDIAGLKNQLRVDSEGYQEVIASLRASLQTAMEERDARMDQLAQAHEDTRKFVNELHETRAERDAANSRLEEAEKKLTEARDAIVFFADEANWRRNGPCDGNSGNFYAITHAEKALSRLSTSRETERKTDEMD